MKGFYVTMRRGKRVAFLAGPYDAHEQAIGAVDSASAMARKMDPWADFDWFGTASLDPPLRLGVFNHLVRNDRSAA